MKTFIALTINLFCVQVNIEEDIPFHVIAPKIALFQNGDCIQHKFQPDITYAVSGKKDSYYQLVVWENSRPRSMIMGFPEHSSEILINEMFKKIDCNPEPDSFTYEIFEDWYDPYRQTSVSFKNMR